VGQCDKLRRSGNGLMNDENNQVNTCTNHEEDVKHVSKTMMQRVRQYKDVKSLQ